MKWISSKLGQASLSFLCFLCYWPVVVYAQEPSYSTEAQEILDTYSADNLDVFKFSINDILNSQGVNVENSNGDPTIFGRTDYGSEFLLGNELETTFSIELPAFVINDLAENEMGDYFPVFKNGEENFSIDFKDLYDEEDGLAITPEMGFVKLVEPEDTTQYTNLTDGDIVEFIVRPTAPFIINHGADAELFFIDRAIPEDPVVAEIDTNQTEDVITDDSTSSEEPTVIEIDTEQIEYVATDDNVSSETETSIYVGPGEEAVTLPNGEIKSLYDTSICSSTSF